ncbi:hypothetical protein U9M48_036216 [Paspalum notatum var. saurae]|uniref:Uncharacterized protein n=1 Tax=Paspalum notatum var. saurae TaxID=547442 RepID=A0AAQ3UD20_PASNO
MPSRQTSITAYQNRRNGQERSGSTALNEQHGNTLPTELDVNDVNSGDQHVTPPTMTRDRDTMPSIEHWPSHARICRTRPEDAGKKFGRGVLKGLKAARRHYENGSDKLPIQFSTRLGGAIGINYRTFVDDVTIYMKRHAPLIGVKTWSDIDIDAKRDIVKDTLEMWDLQDTPENSKKILRMANERYRGWRSTLHATYKCYNTDELCRRNKPDDVGVEEWDYLMECFGTDAKFQRNLETEQEPNDIELWELGHLKNGVWSNTESQAVHENACAVVAEKEKEEGQCSLRSQMSEQVIATSETQRQNVELRNQVRSLQDRNQELDQHIQGLDVQNKDLVDQVHTLGYKNEELNGQVQSLEGQMEKDRVERLKEMEIFKKSIRQEMTKMIASHSSVVAGKNSQPKKIERNSNGSIAQGALLKGQSSQQMQCDRIISPYRLRQRSTKEKSP